MKKLFVPFIVLPIVIGAICCCSSEKLIAGYIEKVVMNTAAILVGLLIAVVGIMLASVNGLYLSLYKMVKSTQYGEEILSDEEAEAIKEGLNGICKELKDNTIAALVFYGLILLLSFWSVIDLPSIRWFIDSQTFTKLYAINVITIWMTGLIFWSVYDCVATCFRITDSFKMVKVKS